MTLRAHVDRYVALKRHLGFKFLNNERMLRSWAAWAMARGDDVIVVDTMIGWACRRIVVAHRTQATERRTAVRRVAPCRGPTPRDSSQRCAWADLAAQTRPSPVDQRRDQEADGGRAVAPAGGVGHASYLALHHRIDGHHRTAALRGMRIAPDRHHR